MLGRRGLFGVRVLAAAVAVGAVGLGSSSTAEAVVGDKPAQTWGVGPATTTTASATAPRVLAILPVGDRIFVGGTFDSVIDPSGVSYPVKNLAVFSASTGAADLGFKAVTNNTVTSLATDGSSLLVGGTFGTVNGVTHPGLAAVSLMDGAVRAWSPGVVGGQVDSISFAGGSVYAGGNFTSIAGPGGSSSQAFLAKLDAGTGLVDTTWSPAPNDRVRVLNVAADGSGRLFLGGDFTSVMDASKANATNKLAAVSLTGSGAVDSFRAGPNNGSAYSPVYDVTSDQGRVYVAAGGGGGACAAYSAGGGAALWSDHSNGDQQSVRLSGGLLYCGGHFSGTASFAGVAREKLAAVDPATGVVAAFNPQINSSQGTWALGSDATHVFVGGDFSTISGVPQPHFAMFIDSAAATAPLAPTNLTAQPGDGVVRLSWSAPSTDGGSPLQKYKVYRSTSPDGEQLTKTPLTTLAKDLRSFDDTTVINGTAYYYKVVATNAVGVSAPSSEAGATPSAAVTLSPPSAPTALSVTNPAGYLHLQWNPPTTNGGSAVTRYNIYRGTSAGAEGSTPVGTVSSTSFDDVYGLTAGTTYYYVVTAVNITGEGLRSAEVSTTVVPGTPGPAGLSATAASGPVVNLSWTVPPDGGSPILKYVLLRDAVRLATLNPAASGQPPPTTYTDKTAVSGASYTYQVKAVNAYGSGQLSNRAVVTVP